MLLPPHPFCSPIHAPCSWCPQLFWFPSVPLPMYESMPASGSVVVSLHHHSQDQRGGPPVDILPRLSCLFLRIFPATYIPVFLNSNPSLSSWVPQAWTWEAPLPPSSRQKLDMYPASCAGRVELRFINIRLSFTVRSSFTQRWLPFYKSHLECVSSFFFALLLQFCLHCLQ